MPNCDFYATLEDHVDLLDWLFAENVCDFYELASDYEKPLQQFHSTREVIKQFERRYPTGKPWKTVHLQLYVRCASPPFKARRIKLNPASCDGAEFRYVADGFGLVQFYLSVPRDNDLQNSHTAHFSAKAAEAWAPITGQKPGPEAWNFELINTISSRLNRQIRKQGVANLGSRPVLPGAWTAWQQGVSFGPYKAIHDVVQMKTAK